METSFTHSRKKPLLFSPRERERVNHHEGEKLWKCQAPSPLFVFAADSFCSFRNPVLLVCFRVPETRVEQEREKKFLPAFGSLSKGKAGKQEFRVPDLSPVPVAQTPFEAGRLPQRLAEIGTRVCVEMTRPSTTIEGTSTSVHLVWGMKSGHVSLSLSCNAVRIK